MALKKEPSRHIFTKAQQLRGMRRAMRTIQRRRNSPKWLLPGMRRYVKKLEDEIRLGRGDEPVRGEK